MRAMRFSEGRIIEAMREHEAGAGGTLATNEWIRGWPAKDMR
jgi:hypothetical protein